MLSHFIYLIVETRLAGGKSKYGEVAGADPTMPPRSRELPGRFGGIGERSSLRSRSQLFHSAE